MICEWSIKGGRGSTLGGNVLDSNIGLMGWNMMIPLDVVRLWMMVDY